MTRFRLTLKNYRSVSDTNPAVFELGAGSVAFVGPNNSGKSTLLRMFFELRPLFSVLGNRQELNRLFDAAGVSITAQGVEDQAELYHDQNDRPLEITLEVLDPSHLSLARVVLTSDRTRMGHWVAKGFIAVKESRVRQIMKADFTREPPMAFLEEGQSVSVAADLGQVTDIARVIGSSLYIGAFRNLLTEGGGAHFDLPIGTAFVEQWDRWKSGGNRWQQNRIQSITKDVARIFGFGTLEINAAKVGSPTLQVIADDRSFRIREFGAGLTQFIYVLGTVGIRRPTLVFIDEPELNLHPTLQFDFLQSIEAYTTEGVIFATHSVGLARAAGESVYACRRHRNHTVLTSFSSTPKLTEFLGEMSFSSFRELGYDTVLLVEGVTEVKAVQEVLRKFGRDHQVVVLPMGGDQFFGTERAAELSELARLTPNVGVLVDSERRSQSDTLAMLRTNFIGACSELGFRTHVTERRAFENYFPNEIVQQVKDSTFRSLEPYEKLGSAPKPWAKTDNWRFARAMSKEEWLENDVGQFIAALP